MVFENYEGTFGLGYLIGRAPKLTHCTDGLWCVHSLPKIVNWQ